MELSLSENDLIEEYKDRLNPEKIDVKAVKKKLRPPKEG
jgi:hypothetical protein